MAAVAAAAPGVPALSTAAASASMAAAGLTSRRSEAFAGLPGAARALVPGSPGWQAGCYRVTTCSSSSNRRSNSSSVDAPRSSQIGGRSQTVASNAAGDFTTAAAAAAGPSSSTVPTVSTSSGQKPTGSSDSEINSSGRGSSISGSSNGSILALACPICHRPFHRPGSAASRSRNMAVRTKYRCDACARSFPSTEGFVDLVVTSGVREYVEPQTNWAGVETFRNPLVSFVYERGWRQGFAGAGFPGPDEEFSIAQRLLQPAAGSTLVDLSCGSGLFTRRFAASSAYASVVALDFSETMLRQTDIYLRADGSIDASKVALVRADVARLPFETGSVAGIHAGAALHCWPNPALAMAEISRVLRPGGVFVATTFLSRKAPIADELVKPFRKAIVSSSRQMKSWEPEELEELCRLCGLANFSQDIRDRFILISAKKRMP